MVRPVMPLPTAPSLITTTELPSKARRYAVVSPAIPAPTMQTWVVRFSRRGESGKGNPPCSEASQAVRRGDEVAEVWVRGVKDSRAGGSVVGSRGASVVIGGDIPGISGVASVAKGGGMDGMDGSGASLFISAANS